MMEALQVVGFKSHCSSQSFCDFLLSLHPTGRKHTFIWIGAYYTDHARKNERGLEVETANNACSILSPCLSLVRPEKELDIGPALFTKPGPFNIRRFIFNFLISQPNFN